MRMKVKLKDVKVGLNQWKFVNTLLKSTVLNTLNAISYLRLVPDGMAYISSYKDLKRQPVRFAYVAFVKEFDEWSKKRGVYRKPLWFQVRRAVQIIMTIADNDHVYAEFCGNLLNRIRTMKPEEVDEYDEDVIERSKKQKFIIKKSEKSR